MAEYMDRDRFADKIREHLRCSNKGSVTEAAYTAILQDLEGLPAADVAPVVHGRWENNKDEYPGSFHNRPQRGFKRRAKPLLGAEKKRHTNRN